jgi:hypothetical protein
LSCSCSYQTAHILVHIIHIGTYWYILVHIGPIILQLCVKVRVYIIQLIGIVSRCAYKCFINIMFCFNKHYVVAHFVISMIF